MPVTIGLLFLWKQHVTNLHLGLTKANIIYKIILAVFWPLILTNTKCYFNGFYVEKLLNYATNFAKNAVLLFLMC